MANPPLFQEVRRPLERSPKQLPRLDGLVPNRRRSAARERREDSMSFRISRRGKEYLETARTLIRAARTMTDRAVARQLQTLANDYRLRAFHASHVDAAKALARSAKDAERERYAFGE